MQTLNDAPSLASDAPGAGTFSGLLEKRRSAKHLDGGELSAELIEAIGKAVQLTPSAYNTPPWHIVLITERRSEFWDLMVEATSSRLEGERLERQLNRFELLRNGAGIALVFERTCVERDIQVAWRLDPVNARSFVDQANGMVQFSIWLTLVEHGLSTSLQHWAWLAEPEISAFVGADPEEFRLTAVLPIGVPATEPGPVDRSPVEHGLSLERFA